MRKEKKGFFIRIGIIGAAIFVTLMFFIGIHIYHGNNMSPGLRDGELIFTLKTARDYAEQVISYKTKDGLKFGRVVGVGGDSIEITEDSYKINGCIPAEKVFYETIGNISVTVPEDHVFVLNDYRVDNSDSREYGCVPIKDIEGVVFFTMSRRGF